MITCNAGKNRKRRRRRIKALEVLTRHIFQDLFLFLKPSFLFSLSLYNSTSIIYLHLLSFKDGNNKREGRRRRAIIIHSVLLLFCVVLER